MERKKQNQKKLMSISFDIDTTVAKKILDEYTIIYKHIENFLKKKDFIRKEGSVYFSKYPTSNNQVIAIVIEMYDKYPYIKKCVRDMIMQEVGPRHSLNSLTDYDGTVGEFSKSNTIKTIGGPIPQNKVESYFESLGMKVPLDIATEIAVNKNKKIEIDDKNRVKKVVVREK